MQTYYQFYWEKKDGENIKILRRSRHTGYDRGICSDGNWRLLFCYVSAFENGV